MTVAQAAALGLVQGLSEFLPISSSAHLSLLPWFLGWQDPGLVFDVALHLGTLFALLAYFYRDWLSLAAAARDPRSPQARLLWLLVLATIPGGVAGLLLERYAETVFRTPELTAATLIVFGLLLGAAERYGSRSRGLASLETKSALAVGAAQALAVIPGVSRSGVTITAALAAGFDPESSVRFSFLLSTPLIAGAAAHSLRHLRPHDLTPPFLAGVAVSAGVGLLVIPFLLRYVRSRSLLPFMWYRLALGAVILLWRFKP